MWKREQVVANGSLGKMENFERGRNFSQNYNRPKKVEIFRNSGSSIQIGGLEGETGDWSVSYVDFEIQIYKLSTLTLEIGWEKTQ